ncbi:unnamed protein product, partial [Rotaria sp. Silwood1]
GHGNGSFASQTRYLAGIAPISVAVDDFNKDTCLDIVVGNRDSNDVSVRLGHGNGSFADETRYSVGYVPQSVAIGDFNNDSLLDIVVVNYGINDVSVLLQYNRVGLTYKVSYASGGASSLQCIVIDDFNSDNNLDMILANHGTNNIGVIIGYGNGSFEKQMMLSTGSNSHPTSIALGDFNGDSLVDIAVANYGTKEVAMMLGNGNETFTSQTSRGKSFDSHPLAITSGDLDNDKRSEIAIVYDDSDNVNIFVAYNHGSFTKETKYSVGSGAFSIAARDFNNDTRLDIVVANRYSNDLSVRLGHGNGSFASQTRYLAGIAPISVAVDD